MRTQDAGALASRNPWSSAREEDDGAASSGLTKALAAAQALGFCEEVEKEMTPLEVIELDTDMEIDIDNMFC